MLLVVLAACAGGPPEASPGQRPRTGGPAPDAAGARVNLDPGLGLLLGTPVYDGDFADPFVLRVGDATYAYATNTVDANVPAIATGTVGAVGSYHGEVLPQLPAWTTPGNVWAPAVLAVGDGYVLWYTTRVAAPGLPGTGRQCLSRATARSPLGPFVDDSAGPTVCQADLGGTIDPSVVTDLDGSTWLLYKNDGNCCGIPTSLWSQRLGPDGTGVVGPAHRLLTATSGWEGDLIEGPSMLVTEGPELLFFSANAWDTAAYAVGWASCVGVTGPCRRGDPDRPWFDSTVFAKGPGGQEFFAALDRVFMVHHGWSGAVGYPQGQRRLFVDIVRVRDGRPELVGSEAAGSSLATLALVGFAAGGLVLAGGVWWWQRRRRTTDGDSDGAGGGDSDSAGDPER